MRITLATPENTMTAFAASVETHARRTVTATLRDAEGRSLTVTEVIEVSTCTSFVGVVLDSPTRRPVWDVDGGEVVVLSPHREQLDVFEARALLAPVLVSTEE